MKLALLIHILIRFEFGELDRRFQAFSVYVQLFLVALILKLLFDFQSQCKKTRSNVAERALEREINRAKQLSLNENAAKKSKNSVSNKENRNQQENSVSNKSSVKMTKPILSSSQSESDTSQTLSNRNNPSTVQRSRAKQAVKYVASDSEEEFRINTPESSSQSSSESEFKLSQVSSSEPSEDRGGSSDDDEEFRLSSDEFNSDCEWKKSKHVGAKPKPAQSKTKSSQSQVAKNKLKDKTNFNANVSAKGEVESTKVSDPNTVTASKTPLSSASSSLTADIDNSTTTTKNASGTLVTRPKTSSGRARKLLTTPGSGRTVNIPALLSSSQGSPASPTGSAGVRIGLSKKARFKSLHANVKRPL